MVMQSDLDWPQHQKDVYNLFSSRYGKQSTDKFISFYASRGDKFQRSYIYYLLAWTLYDDYLEVESSGLRWYAFVGSGGQGKTTLATNVLSFLDPTFDQGRIKFDAFGFVQALDSFDTIGSMKAALLDEPDSSIYPTSKEGIKLRSILGKARQQALFLGYCATDMRDIPSYIYKKLSGVFFTPYKGVAMYFKDRPKKHSYVMQTIKREYEKDGYKVFFKNMHSMGCIRFPTYKGTPFSQEQKNAYDEEKKKDYKEDIKDFLKMKKAHKEKEQMTPMEDLVRKLFNKGTAQTEIAELVGLSKGRISQIVHKTV